MLENTIYSVISPEGCASIMWKDASKKQQAAVALKYTAPDVKALGCVDEVVAEPPGGTQSDPAAGFALLGTGFAFTSATSKLSLPPICSSNAIVSSAVSRSSIRPTDRPSSEYPALPATAPTPPPPRPSKTLDLTIAVAALAWFLAARELSARSAAGIAQRVDLLALGLVLKPLFLLFLLLVGFSLLDFVAHRRSSTRALLALPYRPSARQEVAIGAAIGWSVVLLSVLPVALFGSLHVQLWSEARAFLYAIFTLIGAALSTLALEITFRGYAFRRLIAAVGPISATLLLSFAYGLFFAFSPGSGVRGVLAMALLGLLLSLGWLRTHGLWLSWGLHFAWTASLGILFGLPVAGSTELSSILQTTALGRRGITGGGFGPAGTPPQSPFPSPRDHSSGSPYP